MPASRQLAAIMFTDIVGYTALMHENEQKAVVVIQHYNSSLQKWVAHFNGQVLNYYGDGSLCIFSSSTDAVNCSLVIQKELQNDPAVPLRIGLHIGEIFFEDGKAIGDSVNIASRIQSLGQANTILLSHEIFDKIRNHPEFKTISLGQFDFKNVQEPVEVFALSNEGLNVPKKEQMSGKLKNLRKKNGLRRNIIIALSVLLLGVASVFLYGKYFNKPTRSVENSIAVIPFTNMSNDPQQEYFAEGMMDEILNHLYKIGGLIVISRTSSMTYKESKKTSKEIAGELGVGNLLEGSVQKDGDHIRIIIQLINGKTDEHLWAETYTREFKDVFAIQSEIAQQVAAALKIKIEPEVKERIEKKPTTNSEAYNLFLQAQPIVLSEQGRKLLEAAIVLDTGFAAAYADLASCWIFSGSYGGNLNAKQVMDNALPLLKKAMQLDSNLSSAHAYMALTRLWFDWDIKSAESEWNKFFQLGPSGNFWDNNYRDLLIISGKFSEALAFTQKIFEHDKKNDHNWINLAFSYYFMNQPSRALAILDSAKMLFNNPDIDWHKAWISIYLGKYQDVLDNLNKWYPTVLGDELSPRVKAWYSISYFQTGRSMAAKNLLDSLQLQAVKSPVGSPSYHVAMIYAATGRSELAIQWLEKAFKDHEVEMFWLNVDPLFKPLHNDSRFQVLLTKVGFK
jgi:adenylate cyclase